MNYGMSAAGEALGLGNGLAQEVKDETDEQKKKRLAQMQTQQMLGQAGSLATTMLFGPGAKRGY